MTRWVCRFYATVWIDPHRRFIQLMVNEHMTQIYLGEMRRHLGVAASDRKLHQIVYGDVDPLRCGRAGGTFPIDQQIRPLFR